MGRPPLLSGSAGALGMNPRWAAYLRTTEAPTNHGYIGWIHHKWREWERLNGRPQYGAHTPADHAAFDAWLKGD